MEKPYLLYLSLAAAVDDYNDRHYLNRGHLADALGYRGDNAAKQFSAALNPNNHEKSFNSARIHQLLDALDDAGRVVFFERWMRQWSLRPVSTCRAPRMEIHAIHTLVVETQIEASEAWITGELACADNILTDDERVDLRAKAAKLLAKCEKLIASLDAQAGDEGEEHA